MRLFIMSAMILSASTTAFATNIVPVSNWTSQVYDNQRNLLYMSTSNGLVDRYNPATNSFLSAIDVGTDLSDIDITPDGQYLLAADTATNNGMGMIERVNLATNAVTQMPYPLQNLDSGADQLVALNNGQAIFSSSSSYTGNASNLRSINLNTWTITNFTVNGVVQASVPGDQLNRSFDYSTAIIIDTETSLGGVQIFNANTGTYSVQTQLGAPLNYLKAAISPNDSQAVLGGANVSAAVRNTSNLSTVANLVDLDGGAAYDPSSPLLYDFSLNSGAILEYNTTNYSLVGQINPDGANSYFYGGVPNNGMTVSGNGRYLFDYDVSNLYVYPVPEPTSASILLVGSIFALCRRNRKTFRQS